MPNIGASTCKLIRNARHRALRQAAQQMGPIAGMVNKIHAYSYNVVDVVFADQGV